MPHFWNDILVVTKEELVPDWYTWAGLEKTIQRHSSLPYGLKKVRNGGGGHPMLISFDSLPGEIKKALGDPRQVDHVLEKYYEVDGGAVEFFQAYQFEDGTYLKTEYQEQYITNASVIKALLALHPYRNSYRKACGGTRATIGMLLTNAISFNQTLKVKYEVTHNLPESEKRFKDCLNDFKKEGYASLVSKKFKNQNRRKVTETTLQLLNNLFAKDKTKPTATEIHRRYKSFIEGNLEIINNNTGEVYNPSDFKALSDGTVKNYLKQWSNRIGTHAARSGDRQQYMQQYKPHHSLEKPEFAGSILSIDDRQPPFKSTDGKRIWFYNGIDLGSEAFTCWVYGREKEGIILEFYRQLVRNYAEWGFNLPAELEAEMSLNSSFMNTFLRPGAMFQEVRIEANNARGKRIEGYFKPLRYGLEKKREGWLARPFAQSESNQAAAGKVPAIPYNEIVEGCLLDIETWNNMPHSQYPDKSRWEVFLEKQHPNLKPTNYQGILPYIGHKTQTSCNVGIIRLKGREFLLGDSGHVSSGEKLISQMKQVEGRDITVYWLDGNDGKVLKALVYLGTQYICEAVAKPTYKRAVIEQTPQCQINREIMSKYVATIEAFGRKQKAALEPLTIINNTPAKPKAFVMPGLRKTIVVDSTDEVEILPEPEEPEYSLTWPVQNQYRPLVDRY